jgi:hypothetical protein
MKVGDLVKNKYNGKVSLVTKIEVRRSVPSNRMKTWAYLMYDDYRIQEDHLEIINASR